MKKQLLLGTILISGSLLIGTSYASADIIDNKYEPQQSSLPSASTNSDSSIYVEENSAYNSPYAIIDNYQDVVLQSQVPTNEVLLAWDALEK